MSGVYFCKKKEIKMMKTTIIIILLVLSGCSGETVSTSRQTDTSYTENYSGIDEYCEEYSSHLVDGSLKQQSTAKCKDAYAKDFE